MEPLPSTVSIAVNGERFELPPSVDSDKVKKGDAGEGRKKQRKRPRKKTPDKSSKGAGSKDKALQPSVAMSGAAVDSTDHAGVKGDVGVGGKNAGKKSTSKRRKPPSSVMPKKKKRKPAQPRKPVGDGNLSVPLDNATDKIFGQESREGFDGPREGNQSSYLRKLSCSEPNLIHKEIPHDSDRYLQEKAKAEVAEEHVPVPVEVGECTLINWEHFSLAYEEYCLTKEVKKSNM